MAFLDMIQGATETAGHAIVYASTCGHHEAAGHKMAIAAERTSQHATTVGIDFAGFTTNLVLPAIEATGHCFAVNMLSVATVLTICPNLHINEARDEQAKRLVRMEKHMEAGVARLTNQREFWFNDEPNRVGAWMSNIADGTLIKDMYLPGTHDSCARYGGDFAECQHWSLEQQLEAGIRCFDIRLRQFGNAMCVHHGVVYQRCIFENVVHVLETFIQNNPTEVILAQVTGNGCFHADVQMPFDDQVLQYLQNPNLWLQLQQLSNQTLGGIRGKIVFIGSCKSACDTCVQDFWKTGNADHKANVVIAHGTKRRDPERVHMNWLNAVGRDGITCITPAGMAFQINKVAYDNMWKFGPSVFMMDFPGTGLVDMIIKRN